MLLDCLKARKQFFQPLSRSRELRFWMEEDNTMLRVSAGRHFILRRFSGTPLNSLTALEWLQRINAALAYLEAGQNWSGMEAALENLREYIFHEASMWAEQGDSLSENVREELLNTVNVWNGEKEVTCFFPLAPVDGGGIFPAEWVYWEKDVERVILQGQFSKYYVFGKCDLETPELNIQD